MSDVIDIEIVESTEVIDVTVYPLGITGPPGVSTWGGLTGDIEDQTDLYGYISNIDNTSDANKPISTAARTIFDGIDGNGVVSGITITINSDPTKIDISSGVFHLHSNGNATYEGESAVELIYLTSHNVTYLALDSDGLIIQKSSPFTMSERRQYVLIGAAIHSNKTFVNAINNLPDISVTALSQLNDLMDGLKGFNFDGNMFSANGANLFLNKSSGKLFKKGVNFTVDEDNPHVKELAALVVPSNIRYRLSDGTEYADTDSVSLYYESSPGVRTVIAGNRYSIQRIVVFSSNLIRIQYGQAVYTSLSLATQAISTESFTWEQNMAENGLLRCFLVVRGGTTSLLDSTRALFIHADKFGQIPLGSGGGTTNLQQAYNNSETPEILTSIVLGALSVQCGSAADTDNIFEGLNKAGTITSSIAGDGQSKFGDIVNGNYSEIEADGTLKFNGNATVWRDINLSGASLVAGGSAAPDPISFVDSNLLVYGFDGSNTTERLYGSCEMQHDYKEGSDIELHIHWTPTTTNVGTVQWKVYYTWQNNAGAIFAAPTLLTPAVSNSGGVAWANNYTTVATISGAGKTINSQLVFQIFRVPTEDTYTGDAALMQFGIHYQCDTTGSRLLNTK